jgi:hypothetical protein
VSESTPKRRAISSFATPSAAHSSALAWITLRCGNVVDRAIRVSSARCSALTGNAGAVTVGTHHGTALFRRQTTRSCPFEVVRPAASDRVEPNVVCSAHRGYLLTTATAGARPGSVEVLGGTFSLRLPADSWCGSLMACVLAGHRGAEWLKRGLPCSK